MPLFLMCFLRQISHSLSLWRGKKCLLPSSLFQGQTEGKAKVITVAGSFLHESALPRSLRSNNRTRGSVYISSSRLTICPSSSRTTNAFAFSAALSFCRCQNYRLYRLRIILDFRGLKHHVKLFLMRSSHWSQNFDYFSLPERVN